MTLAEEKNKRMYALRERVKRNLEHHLEYLRFYTEKDLQRLYLIQKEFFKNASSQTYTPHKFGPLG